METDWIRIARLELEPNKKGGYDCLVLLMRRNVPVEHIEIAVNGDDTVTQVREKAIKAMEKHLETKPKKSRK